MDDFQILTRRKEKYMNKSMFYIITQRFNNIKNCFFTNSVNKSDDENGDLIEIKHCEPITGIMLNSINSIEKDIEFIESGNKEHTYITNDIFRTQCNEAKHLCVCYINKFFYLEKFALILTCLTPIYAILICRLKFSNIYVYLILVILICLIIFNSVGDWGRLREKYSRLYHMFEVLSNSNDIDRVNKFLSHVKSFGTNELFIDSITN